VALAPGRGTGYPLVGLATGTATKTITYKYAFLPDRTPGRPQSKLKELRV
jgi:hypothetical protein